MAAPTFIKRLEVRYEYSSELCANASPYQFHSLAILCTMLRQLLEMEGAARAEWAKKFYLHGRRQGNLPA